MTKEQEEAIEYVQEQIDYYKEQIKFIEAVDSHYYDEEYELYKNRVKQFETVLSMLKEKDKEIEKKDKINKLLIDFIYRMSIKRPGTIMYDLKEDGFDTSQCGNCKDKSCKECIKQYFGSKVKK